MHFFGAIACVAACLIQNPAAADILNPNIIVSAFDTGFEREAAAHDMTVAVLAGECQKDVKAVCNYSLAASTSIIASGDALDGPIGGLSLIYQPDGEPGKLTKHLLLLIAVAEPNVSKKLRGKDFAKLSEAMGRHQSEMLSFRGAAAKFTIAWMLGTCMVTIEPLN